MVWLEIPLVNTRMDGERLTSHEKRTSVGGSPKRMEMSQWLLKKSLSPLKLHENTLFCQHFKRIRM